MYYIFTNTHRHTILLIIIWTISKQVCKEHFHVIVFGRKNSFIFPIRVVEKHSNHLEAKILLKTMLLSKSDRHVIDTFEAVADLPVTQSNQLWWVFFNTKIRFRILTLLGNNKTGAQASREQDLLSAHLVKTAENRALYNSFSKMLYAAFSGFNSMKSFVLNQKNC